jgi:hypothetical protein
MDLIYSGSNLRVMENSDYGRAFSQFEARHMDALDRHTTVLVIGDGRSNYQDPRQDILKHMGERAARILWLNPEPPASWGFGDSAMPAFLPFCEAHPCHNLATLTVAVDRIVAPLRR